MYDERYRVFLASAQNLPLMVDNESIDCIVTSPPYFDQRWPHTDSPDEIGQEKSLDHYLERLVGTLAGLAPLLKKSGNLFINIGDTFRRKRQLFIPERLAIQLSAAGLPCRQRYIWQKPNAQPGSDHGKLTPTTESVLHCVKSLRKYYFGIDEVRVPHKSLEKAMRAADTVSRPQQTKMTTGEQREDLSSPRARSGRGDGINYYHPLGRNPGDVIVLSTQRSVTPHFSMMPMGLAEFLIKLGCPPGGVVLDPFHGAGTTMIAALKLHRLYIGGEISQDYIDLSIKRMEDKKC